MGRIWDVFGTSNYTEMSAEMSAAEMSAAEMSAAEMSAALDRVSAPLSLSF